MSTPQPSLVLPLAWPRAPVYDRAPAPAEGVEIFKPPRGFALTFMGCGVVYFWSRLWVSVFWNRLRVW